MCLCVLVKDAAAADDAAELCGALRRRNNRCLKRLSILPIRTTLTFKKKTNASAQNIKRLHPLISVPGV